MDLKSRMDVKEQESIEKESKGKDFNEHNHVAIVSHQGRGNALAQTLNSNGMQVSLFDVTSQLGPWPAEDTEGPFGFFRSEILSPDFLERLNEEERYELTPKGFTFLTREGPLEMKGPNTLYLFKKWNWTDSEIESLYHHRSVPSVWTSELGIEQKWPIAFSQIFASTSAFTPRDQNRVHNKLPLACDFYVRMSSRKGHENSLNWLERKNVKVYRNTEILDISLQGKSSWIGLELKGEKSGHHKFNYFVFCFTSEELKHYKKNIFEKSYQKAIESEWTWVRFRGRVHDVNETSDLPLHFILFRDPYGPWTHHHMIVVQRTSSGDQFDFWIKISTVQKFNKEYLSNSWRKICDEWLKVLPRVSLELVSNPQEYYYSYQELGPSPFPIYSKKNISRLNSTRTASNVWFMSPEQWDAYGWESIYLYQNKVSQEIIQSWKNLIKKELKRGNHDSEIHP